MVPLHVAHVVLLFVLSTSQTQDDEVVLYDFAEHIPSWERDQTEEEVASGKFVIRGKFDTKQALILKIAVYDILKGVCKSGSLVVTPDISVETTSSKEWHFLRIDFKILPPLGGGGDCTWSLLQGAEGVTGPPFDDDCPPCERKKPAFRDALFFQLRNYAQTKDLDISKWFIKVDTLFCVKAQVKRPKVFTVETEKVYSCEQFMPEPTVTQGPDVTTSTTTRRANWAVSSSDPCDWANSPCMCATMTTRKCLWKSHSSGGKRCMEMNAPPKQSDVCEYCPQRFGCPEKPEVLCANALSMCACALASPMCNWTVETATCSMPAEGPRGVPCSLCPLSSFGCPRPVITGFEPPYGLTMGEEDTPYEVNATFDRPIRLPASSELTGSVSMDCSLRAGEFLPKQAPQNPDIVLEVPMQGRSVLNDRTLQLRANGMEFWSRYECHLVIGEGVVVGKDDAIPGLGSGKGTYKVAVIDNVRPIALSFEPKLSGLEVSLETAVATITFNEPVHSRGVAAILAKLPSNGDEWEVVADLPVSPLVIGPNKVKAQIPIEAGLFQDDTQYSIILPEGAVADRFGNKHLGIQEGQWTFRTVMSVRIVEEKEIGMKPEETIGIVVAATFISLGVVVATVALCRWRLARKFEESRVQPTQVYNPTVEEPISPHGKKDLLPPTGKYWEQGLVRTKDLEVDDLSAPPSVTMQALALPGSIPPLPGSGSPAQSPRTGSRRPSTSSNRSPSNDSGRVQCHTNTCRRPSRDARRPSRDAAEVAARRAMLGAGPAPPRPRVPSPRPSARGSVGARMVT